MAILPFLRKRFYAEAKILSRLDSQHLVKVHELSVTTTFVTGETAGTKPVMGTYWYLAPEIRHGGEASLASDWYALGVLMFRLLTGMWYEPNTKAFDLLAPFSWECQRIVRRLLSDDPVERCPRPSMPDVSSPSRRWQVLDCRRCNWCDRINCLVPSFIFAFTFTFIFIFLVALRPRR